MGEAKRRAAWIAKGGEDWGLTGFRSGSRWAVRIRGLGKEEVAKLELGRSQRRTFHMLALCGMVMTMHRPSKHRTTQGRRPQARGR